MNSELRNLFVVFSIVIIFWISTIIHRYNTQSDIQVFRNTYKLLDINGWSILHYLNYLVAGFVAPSYWKELIGIGIGFELFEAKIENHVEYVDCKMWSDVLVNSLGVITGVFLRNQIGTKTNSKYLERGR